MKIKKVTPHVVVESLNVGPIYFDVTCNNGAQFIDVPKITKSEVR